MSGALASRFEREYPLPVVLHADDRPALALRLVVECLGEGSDSAVRQAVGWPVGIFALRVVVQPEHRKPRTVASLGVLQHLLVADRVAERRTGATTDHQVNALGLAGVIVVQQQFGIL